MTRRTEARFPFGPLEQLAAKPTVSSLAGALGTNQRQVHRWRSYGVTEAQADVLTARLDLHPAVVWGDDFYKHAPRTKNKDNAEAPRAGRCRQCWREFTPLRRTQRFCRNRCYRSWHSADRRRRRYAEDPTYAERRRVEARERYWNGRPTVTPSAQDHDMTNEEAA